jgi:hypothetical protein
MTIPLGERRDLLALRQKARQIAHLLHFAPLDEACVAAGVFAVAAQAREAIEQPEICFHLDPQQLIVTVRPRTGSPAPKPEALRSLLRLAKPLPEAARHFAVEDLGWLIARINDSTPADLYGELCKQNQEVLQLLHLLQHPGEQAASFSAA